MVRYAVAYPFPGTIQALNLFCTSGPSCGEIPLCCLATITMSMSGPPGVPTMARFSTGVLVHNFVAVFCAFVLTSRLPATRSWTSTLDLSTDDFKCISWECLTRRDRVNEGWK